MSTVLTPAADQAQRQSAATAMKAFAGTTLAVVLAAVAWRTGGGRLEKAAYRAIAAAEVLASGGAYASDASVCNDPAAYQVAAEITVTDECAMEAIWAGANGGTVSAKCIALLGEVDKAMVRKEHECMVSLGTKK